MCIYTHVYIYRRSRDIRDVYISISIVIPSHHRTIHTYIYMYMYERVIVSTSSNASTITQVYQVYLYLNLIIIIIIYIYIYIYIVVTFHLYIYIYIYIYICRGEIDIIDLVNLCDNHQNNPCSYRYYCI